MNEILCNQEAENNIIGSLLIEPDLIEEITIKPDQFYQKQNQLIFEQIVRLKESNEPIDLISVSDGLSKLGLLENAGGTSRVTSLMNNVITTANVKYHEKIVKEKFKYRQVLELSAQLQQVVKGQEDLSALYPIIEKLNNLDSFEQSKRQSIKEVLVKVYDDIERRSSSGDAITGIETGFGELDKILNGLHKSELVILAARPSIGKTALALNLGSSIAGLGSGIPVVYSLETTNENLVERQLVANGNIDAQRLRMGQVTDDDWRKITQSMGELGNKKMYYHDLSHCTPSYIRSDVKELKRLHPGENLVLIIDHLQLMRSDKKEPNRNAEVGAISRDLKMIAKEMDVNVVLLSQLSRGVESRQDKRPMMSDLRDSGEVEQNADVVAFLYRDDYYDKETENKNIVEVIIAKQRNGPTGTVQMAFLKEYNKFVNLERRLQA